MEDGLIAAGLVCGQKCTKCTKTALSGENFALEETSNFAKYPDSGSTIGGVGMIPAGKEHHDTNGRHQDQKKQRQPEGAFLLIGRA